MSKKKKRNTVNLPKRSLRLTQKQQVIFGSFLFLLGVSLLFSFASYLFTWKADQSEVDRLIGVGKLEKLKIGLKNSALM